MPESRNSQAQYKLEDYNRTKAITSTDVIISETLPSTHKPLGIFRRFIYCNTLPSSENIVF